MAKLFLVPVDLNKNELRNARIQNLASAPASPVSGQIYYNTGDNKSYIYNGTAWEDVSGDIDSITAGSTKLSVTSGTGPDVTIDAVEANFTHNNIGGTLGISKGGTNATTFTASEIVRMNAGGTAIESSGKVAPSGAIVGTTDSQTLTNKTFDTSLNTVSNIATSMFATNVVDTDVTLAANSDTRLASQKAVKAYIDARDSGLDPKASARVATAAALPANTAAGSGVGKTLTMTAVGVLTVDGVATVLNNRILVKNEATGANNGVYKVTTEGTGAVAAILTRAVDFDANAEVTAGAYFFVEEGTANGDAGFVLTTDNPITVDTTALTFTQFSGAGQITAGTGMTKTGNTLDVIAADTSITVNADNLQVNPNSTGGLEVSSGLRIKSDVTTANTIGVTVVANGAGVKIDSASFADSGSETLALAAGVAGNGLTLTTGVLAVGAGTGITANADDIAVNFANSTEAEAKTVTNKATPPSALTNFPVKKIATITGDGVLTSFTVTHSLSTRDVQVTVYDGDTPFADVIVDVERPTTAAVDIKFAAAPANLKTYKVVVIG